MKSKKISNKNIVGRFPLVQAVIVFTCLHYWDVSAWVYGAVGCIYVIACIAWIIDTCNSQVIDIFAENEDINLVKSKFSQRYNDIISRNK